ncbi:uncharacterized protein LOC104419438 [Eucalyptus grandis]|uniref:uncharacterized protein LOC104419438 n=1 Tax=Eucalyptus grandis TaxID=71139 RepID=UPI00192E8747|nr:uncharacterized protein LOC104419438 [Eucalyptus grandis]
MARRSQHRTFLSPQARSFDTFPNALSLSRDNLYISIQALVLIPRTQPFESQYLWHAWKREREEITFAMARWVKPEVYPLMAAMTFVTGMCVFQLTRNVALNPDVRINKLNRRTGVLDNGEEGEKYSQHGLRKFLRTRPPEIMPAINHFFSEDK